MIFRLALRDLVLTTRNSYPDTSLSGDYWLLTTNLAAAFGTSEVPEVRSG